MYKVNNIYVKHILKGRCFYRIPGIDSTCTLLEPKEGFYKTKEETGGNETWFEERWLKLNNTYVKHILKGRCFYRIPGIDSTCTLLEPKEGFYKTKEETGVNETWFEERWLKLNNPYVKHILKGRCFYRREGIDSTCTLLEPKEGFYKTKEETGGNETWFEDLWSNLNSEYIYESNGKKLFKIIS